MDDDLQDESLARLPQNPKLSRDDLLAVDDEAVPHPLQGLVRRAYAREDLVLLREIVSGVHDAIGDVAVVRKEQEALCVAVEATDRVDTLRHVNELHHRAALAFVADGRNEAGRLVEHENARSLGPQDLAIDPDLGFRRIDSGA